MLGRKTFYFGDSHKPQHRLYRLDLRNGENISHVSSFSVFQESSPRNTLEDAGTDQQSRQKRGKHGPGIQRWFPATSIACCFHFLTHCFTPSKLGKRQMLRRKRLPVAIPECRTEFVYFSRSHAADDQ